jgi:hypothetical protein
MKIKMKCTYCKRKAIGEITSLKNKEDSLPYCIKHKPKKY